MEGALVHHVETGFIAVKEEGIGVSGCGTRGGDDETVERVSGGLARHGFVDGTGLDGPAAAHAPVSGDHLFDHAELHFVGGLEAVDVLLEEGAEVFGVLTFEDDAIGEQAVADGVDGRTLLTLGRNWSAGAGAVGPRGKYSSVRGHKSCAPTLPCGQADAAMRRGLSPFLSCQQNFSTAVNGPAGEAVTGRRKNFRAAGRDRDRET